MSFPRVTEIRDLVRKCFKDPCCINSSFTNCWKTAIKFIIVSKFHRGNILLSASSVWRECENVYMFFTFLLLQKGFYKLTFGESGPVG